MPIPISTERIGLTLSGLCFIPCSGFIIIPFISVYLACCRPTRTHKHSHRDSGPRNNGGAERWFWQALLLFTSSGFGASAAASNQTSENSSTNKKQPVPTAVPVCLCCVYVCVRALCEGRPIFFASVRAMACLVFLPVTWGASASELSAQGKKREGKRTLFLLEKHKQKRQANPKKQRSRRLESFRSRARVCVYVWG